jgi:DedD protein
MNQELKHRLIGAVVITALATIFIPMLFDDPIDDTGQAVSELRIPADPAAAGAAAENKSPTSIDQVIENPEGDSAVSGQDSNDISGTEPSGSDEAGPEETEQAGNESQNKDKASDASDEGMGQYAEEDVTHAGDSPENASKLDQETPSMDTGVIEQAKNSPNPEKASDSADNSQNAGGSSQPRAEKTVNDNIVMAPAKKIVKDSPVIAQKPVAVQHSVNKPTASLSAIDEPKKSAGKAAELPKKAGQEMVRWYLQAGSFGRKENAISQFDLLKKQGLPVLLETVKTDKGDLYRIKVGPELSKKRAADMKVKLENQKIKAMMIAE